MKLPNDPIMLMSVINLKLREELCEKLAFAGFKYDEKQNMFF